MECIKENHEQSFEMLSLFYARKRFYTVYGNHDIVKKYPNFQKKHLDMEFYPGIVLHDTLKGHEIFLTHGHQADLLNSTFWPLSRFLVRYLWKMLEYLGVPDPTSAAKNNKRKKKTEKKLANWAIKNKYILISGHTHHPMTGSKDSPYCNTGSCVHPTGITAIEIERRTITLVKWSVNTKRNLTLYASREMLGSAVSIDSFF